VRVDTDDPPPSWPAGPCDADPCETLSEYGFFTGDLADLTPALGVHSYEPNARLWSDNAGKSRFIFLPEGESVDLGAVEDWGFPVGSVVIKSFWFAEDLAIPEGPRRHIETRLLVRGKDGWEGEVYLWNDDQTEAERFVAGTRVTLDYTDLDGVLAEHEYVVPNTNQCITCHGRDDEMHLLGVITPQLNRWGPDGVNQLTALAEAGLFADALPDPESLPTLADPEGDEAVTPRARAWLHANCSHCHRLGGGGGSSGLTLLEWEETPVNFGVCRSPVAAGAGTGGFSYDISPGHPEESILVYRMSATEPEVKMPEIPNLLVPEAGVQLVADWIAQMDYPDCL
jgi:uncharacterized repeat protein (TIGR03806 family)